MQNGERAIDLRRSHLVTDVADSPGTFQTAAAVPVRRLTRDWIVAGRQRRTRRSDVVAGRRVVTRQTLHRVDRRHRPFNDDDDDDDDGQMAARDGFLHRRTYPSRVEDN